jgi:hypothetical protein
MDDSKNKPDLKGLNEVLQGVGDEEDFLNFGLPSLDFSGCEGNLSPLNLTPPSPPPKQEGIKINFDPQDFGLVPVPGPDLKYQPPPQFNKKRGKSRTYGKKKIKIEYIPGKRKRNQCLCKRRSGLLKKAQELDILTGANIMVIVATEKKCYTYASMNFAPLLNVILQSNQNQGEQ